VARERIDTLMARSEGEGRYRFDIHLQGPHETIFFDI
jgi:protocatechuate 3,4-dioxygenase alpha subunit